MHDTPGRPTGPDAAPDAPPHPETVCAHWAEDPAAHHGAVVPPIYQNSLFLFPDSDTRERNYALSPEYGARVGGAGERYDYTRVANPTTDVAERKIAALEKGEAARCFASGMGAISAAVLSCVRAGSHIILPETVYGPTRQFAASYLPRFGVSATYVDGSDPQEFADALRPETSLIFLESPSSVVMKQQDLAAVASLACARGVATVCDNSWASPLFQNPLEFGIDLVVHSATKYLGGHSDIVAGVVVGSAERIKQMTFEEGCLLGAVLDPFAAWLLLRGLRTLPVRMERHQQNARALARALSEHPRVARVFYPGLPDDPQPDLTRRQLRGTSGLLSVQLKEPGRAAAHRVADSLRWFGIGCSWGGFESLALPAAVPATAIDGTGREPAWLLRLHVGLEHADDLWADLEQALEK